jgi:GH24 family phage-related lysozyme (muramidase)
LFSVPGGFAPEALSLGPDGVALLKAVETLRLTPYDDQTGRDVSAWVAGATIGFGHLIAREEWAAYERGITEDQADALFLADLAPFEDAVRGSIATGLQQYEFDALVMLAFNIGVSGFKGSSVVKLVNDPQASTGHASLEAAWKAWNKSQGRVMKGLDNRRAAEWRVFTRAVYARW